MCKKGHWLAKITPPPLVVVVTNMSYEQEQLGLGQRQLSNPSLLSQSNYVRYTITKLLSQFYKILIFRIVGDGHQSSSRIPLLRTHFCNPLFKVDLGHVTSDRRGMMFLNCTFRIPKKGT